MFLTRKLSQSGITFSKLNEEELWERIRHRAVDQFSRLCETFVNRIRQNSYSPDQFTDLISRHNIAFPHESDFLKIISKIFRDYIARIEETGEDDFSGPY